jgi:cell division protein FtsX
MCGVMQPPTAAAPQRLCPRCSTLAHTAQRRCPFCGASYARRPLLGTAALLAVFLLLLLGGLAALLVTSADRVQREIDRTVERELDTQARQVERRIIRELDRRLPGQLAP